ncbi:hypothetical protein [Flavobacterium sp.]|uniref:hypothetical protein n=1 Tax=Flavobacterium sp. TaxID=239 RepID=UPI0037C06E52
MLRLHNILDIDRTPYLHTHPFDYVSIVLFGGYDEQVLQEDGSIITIEHKIGSVIKRKGDIPHRISAIRKNCFTLFLAKDTGFNWNLIRHHNIEMPIGYINAKDGIYHKDGSFTKRFNQMWYVKCKTREEAIASTKLSIHQNQGV